MEINYLIFFGTALIPLIVGSIWYNPKIFGTAWMKSAGLTEEQASSGNMPLIFGLVYVFSIFLSAFFVTWSIHQMAQIRRWFLSLTTLMPPIAIFTAALDMEPCMVE